MSWPLWASNFVLQRATGPLSSVMDWSNVGTNGVTVTPTGNTATLPLSATNTYYRLIQQ
jgi:hypothetical protein